MIISLSSRLLKFLYFLNKQQSSDAGNELLNIYMNICIESPGKVNGENITGLKPRGKKDQSLKLHHIHVMLNLVLGLPTPLFFN